MSRRKQTRKHLRPLHSVYFLVAGSILLVIGLSAYRQNNVRMLQLRNAVFAADETDGDTEAALRALREHIYSHMNTDLTPKADSIRPPIQLKFRYERLVAAEKARVSAINETIYKDAQAECERQNSTSLLGRDRVPCIQAYVTSHPVAVASTIPDSLYKFDFLSPSWTFDFAGWVLAIAGLLLFIALVRFVLERWIRATSIEA